MASQIIRFSPPNPAHTQNPTYLTEDIISITTQLTGSGVPSPSIGILGNVYTDVTTGNQYQLTLSGWVPTIALGSFAVIPDPLLLNTLEVSTIQPNTTNNNNIELKLPATSDFVNVGVTGHLTNLQLQGDGSVISNSATASHIVADGAGHQVTYGPSSIISSGTALTVTGDTGLSLVTNSNDIQFDANNNVILNPSNIVLSQQGIYMAAGQMYTSQADGTSGVLVAADSVKLKCSNNDVVSASTANVNFVTTGDCTFTVAGNPTLAVQSGDIALTGHVLPTAGFTYNVGGPANVFSEGHFDTVFLQNGLVTQPTVTFDNDLTSGLYLNAVGNPVVTASSTAVMGWTSGTAHSMAHIIPTANNTYDLGSAAPLAWRNIYSNNVLNVVSDERRKKNIEALNIGLDLVENLCPVSFQFKDSEDEKYKLGFIAQQTQACMSEYNKDYDVVNYDQANDSYTMKYESLIAVLVKSVQELSARVKELESK